MSDADLPPPPALPPPPPVVEAPAALPLPLPPPPPSGGPELRRVWAQRAPGAVSRLLAASDGTLAAVGDAVVYVYSKAKPYVLRHQLRPKQGAPAVTACALTTAGRHIIVGGADGVLRIFRLEGGEETLCTPLPPPKDGFGEEAGGVPPPVSAIATSDPAKHIAAAAGRHFAILGQGGEPPIVASAGAHAVRQLAWLSPGELLVAAGPAVALWAVAEGECHKVATYDHGALAVRMAVSPNGKHLAVACEGGSLQVWAISRAAAAAAGASPESPAAPGGAPPPPPPPSGPSSFELLHLVDSAFADGPSVHVAWDAGSRLLAVAAGEEAHVWDMETIDANQSAMVAAGPAGAHAHIASMAFQPATSLLAAAYSDGARQR